MTFHAVRRLLAPALLVLAGAAAGCGAERPGRVPVHPAPGAATHRMAYPRVGMSLRIPKTVPTARRRPPGVFKAVAGKWLVSAFAYPRREQLPRNGRELEAARRRLVRETRRRDGHYHLIRSRTTRIAGARAIELLGDQTISRLRSRFRSLHVFKGRGEYVVELAAPPREFSEAQRALFAPVVRSLRVDGKIRNAKK